MKNIIKFYEKGSVEILYGESSHCFPLHSHECFCVGAITKGSALFTINNSKCLLKEPMLFILPSNTGISITTNSQYNYITICFKNELKKQIENLHFNKYFLTLQSNDEILTLCDTFRENNDEIQLLTSILKLINNTITNNSLIEKNQPNETVLSICEYIKKNATENFDLDTLAKSFYLSKFHLIRIFKKEMGVTPYQYYIQSKMRVIRKEVFDVKSETDLAVNLNLSDSSHLCKIFKRQMGISIQDYKKNLVRK
ncbi:AraC-type DNA-binding protein [Clostridium cavendishii DSM 21758]|uniref:AraC-type DNA-binding protein n=1 Tax=Clostridium cavendishii DSM 21758 TaxID=1121302 RepID=A0A1M6R5U1_9CLOT|nr:AraC family transcriptional regulator [Clostridium cavendishii]SHK27718.1 AraC-type DNA-binding protein [Clostridium cavendishii DSM 21758]